MTESIQHAHAAGSVGETARLIEQYGLALVARGESRVILAGLEALPDRFFEDRPMLCVVHGSILALLNRTEAAEQRLQAAERAIARLPTNEQSRHLRGIVLTIRAELTRYRGDMIASVNFAREAATLLPTTDRAARQRADDYAALDFLLTGDMVHASEVYPAELIATTRAAGDLIGHFSVISTVGWARVYQGRLREAAQLFQMGLTEVSAAGLQHFFADMFYHLGLGVIQYEWNELDTAEDNLRRGLQLAHGTSVEANGALVGSMALARLHQARGDSVGALEIHDRFVQSARKHHFAELLITRGDALRAHLLLRQGEIDAAWRWLETNGLTIDSEPTYPLEHGYLTLARVLIARHEHAAALALLARLLQDAEPRARFNSVIEIQMLQALALRAAGNVPESLTTLEHALTLAGPEGYVRTFIDEGEPIRLLIADYRVQIEKHASHLKPYVTRLLAAFPAAHSTPPEAQISNPTLLRFGDRSQQSALSNLIEPLSERELEVLRLIADGLSNQEIAAKLIVGLGTVKTHINNIYRKLDVNSRTQALHRARELGLL